MGNGRRVMSRRELFMGMVDNGLDFGGIGGSKGMRDMLGMGGK